MGAPQFDDDRVLCQDGACIGLIGPDGRCKVCNAPGLKGAPAPRAADSAEPADEWADDDYDDADSDDGGDGVSDEIVSDRGGDHGGDDFDDRELCSDGSCVGLIGPRGVCTTCGAPRGGSEEE